MKDIIVDKFIKKTRSLGNKIIKAYLFGSRARGTYRSDSDHDVLMIVAPNFSAKDKDALYESVMDILFATGELISLKIFKEVQFERLKLLGTPFISNVMREGISVG